MWYFVEKNGKALAKSKEVYLIWKKWGELVKAGEDPDKLDVVDSFGHSLI